MYDGCDSVAFVYWLRLKQYLQFSWRLSPIYGCDSLGTIWCMGMLRRCICSTLVSVCAMKGIPIAPLVQWGTDVCLVYYEWLYIFLFLLFLTGDHCSSFSDDRFQPNKAIFKSDGSDVYAYILCTWWSGVETTKTRFKLLFFLLLLFIVGIKCTEIEQIDLLNMEIFGGGIFSSLNLVLVVATPDHHVHSMYA